MATSFTFQTWNLWFGGSHVHDGHKKLLDVAKTYPADIRIFQECQFELAGDASRALGMNHYQQGWDNAVSATYPIEGLSTDTDPFATAAKVTVDSHEILVWCIHLAPDDYGPYAALRGEDANHVHSAPGELKRLEQIKLILSETERITGGETIPTIISGDFNSPAGTDWQQRSDRPTMAWPSVDILNENGYTDAYRTIHQDAESAWGDTWSTIEPLDKEPRDRIDFVFTKGFDVTSARIIGNAPDGHLNNGATDPTFVNVGGVADLTPNEQRNDYPSDHLIVEVGLQLP